MAACCLVVVGWGLSVLRKADRPHPNPSPEGEGLSSLHVRNRSVSDIRHPGLDPGSILSTPREWTPDQVRGDDER
ncbi:protein of unknown function [uncultured Sphingopyxis sp.]|uniref:Uncharacterized protein n=1 Tax=uncultured Sphingopyxis sp. TaxID=310581 RepID=A0A1Y5PNV8_9SPHN|nr:protein of unknown function [uncultured Sphingopyxis sp.]